MATLTLLNAWVHWRNHVLIRRHQAQLDQVAHYMEGVGYERARQEFSERLRVVVPLRSKQQHCGPTCAECGRQQPMVLSRT